MVGSGFHGIPFRGSKTKLGRLPIDDNKTRKTKSGELYFLSSESQHLGWPQSSQRAESETQARRPACGGWFGNPQFVPSGEENLTLSHENDRKFEILEADKNAPRRQRHTAIRIFERLRDEHGYAGGYTTVKDAVRIWKQSHKEVFLPLHHRPHSALGNLAPREFALSGQADYAR
jgi:hypothetical protein